MQALQANSFAGVRVAAKPAAPRASSAKAMVVRASAENARKAVLSLSAAATVTLTMAGAAFADGATPHASDVNLVMSGTNLAFLALGRFVFLPYQRDQVAKAGSPMQNGVTHAAAGDIRAQEATGVLKTGDPAGFNLVDVFAWGSLGHAAGFAALASQSFGQ